MIPVQLRPGVGAVGAGLCVGGIALLLVPALPAAAIGLEAVALAFWLWSRAAEDARDQIPRWVWLRRPATALWVAVACHAVSPGLAHVVGGVPAFRANPLPWVEAAAVLWAGLELVAALPMARPFSDLPGPYLRSRRWLPVAIPSAGFILLWRQAAHWTAIPAVRHAAIVLLLFTALLSALRAFARRGWTASLRWLAVTQTSLAVVLLCGGLLPAESVFLLWLGGLGGPAFLLAGELTGASPRRGRASARLWRGAGFVSAAALSWPVLLTVADAFTGALRVAALAVAAAAVAVSTWVMVGRLEVAPERRRLMRQGSGGLTSRTAAALVLLLGPVGLVLAWWEGFEPHWLVSALALAPAGGGALAALTRKEQKLPLLPGLARAAAESMRPLAGAAYTTVVRIEQRLVRILVALTRGLSAPLRDLHTGDAQEYLLFLVGVGVLVLLLPLLR